MPEGLFYSVLYSLPHAHIASIIGYKERPLSERLYSTLGGI